MKKIYLISNDKIWISNKKYTSNNDLDNIITCLNDEYDVNLICRKSIKELHFQLNGKFNFCQLKNINERNISVLLISITPFNFFSLLYLLFIKRVRLKGFVYLRSDGFLEYKYRFGLIGYYFYYIMFLIIKKYLKILSCSNNFTKVKVDKLLHPSELNPKWFVKDKSKKNINIDFLYVGRFKKDKGTFYLVNMFKNYLGDYNLTIVGNDKALISKKYYSDNINYINSITNIDELIKIYDCSKVFILPSFIEGFPKVISESLARLKPIIIFEEIEYVINKRKGIFVCKRNEKDLRKTINYILKNYSDIQRQIEKNYFYTKDNFKKEFLTSIKYDF